MSSVSLSGSPSTDSAAGIYFIMRQKNLRSWRCSASLNARWRSSWEERLSSSSKVGGTAARLHGGPSAGHLDEQPHAEPCRALAAEVRAANVVGGAGDVEVGPRQLPDEAVQQLRTGDRACLATLGQIG